MDHKSSIEDKFIDLDDGDFLRDPDLPDDELTAYVPTSRRELNDAWYDRCTGNPLEDAIKLHRPDLVEYAVAKGDEISPQFDAALEIARGICADELDQFNHQSADSVGKTLDALSSAGIDFNDVRDGKPASHRLTEYYGPKMISHLEDPSYAAEVGMSDVKHNERLAAFASRGVDFTATDEEGRRPKDLLHAMAKEVVSTTSRPFAFGETTPKARQQSYTDHVEAEYAPVHRAAREYRISSRAASQASHATSDLAKTMPQRRTAVSDQMR